NLPNGRAESRNGAPHGHAAVIAGAPDGEKPRRRTLLADEDVVQQPPGQEGQRSRQQHAGVEAEHGRAMADDMAAPDIPHRVNHPTRQPNQKRAGGRKGGWGGPPPRPTVGMKNAATAVTVISPRYVKPAARWRREPLVDRKTCQVPIASAGSTVARWIWIAAG